MGWGIIIKDVNLRNVTIEGLDDEIEDIQADIKSYEMQIAMLVAAPVESMNTEDVEGNKMHWHEYMPNELGTILQEYKEAVERLMLLELAKENESIEDY